MKRRVPPAVWLFAGFMLCVALMMLNAALYFAHPAGRGLDLFAAVWCGIMALVVLANMARL